LKLAIKFNYNCKNTIREIIPPDISGTHRAISIQLAESYLKKAGFINIEIMSIGPKVFGGFCKWAAQEMSQMNHTPRWLEAYEKNLVGYYMIKGEKPENKI